MHKIKELINRLFPPRITEKRGFSEGEAERRYLIEMENIDSYMTSEGQREVR
ncbi:MAG: hypothetical protein GX061_09255 [Eubacteriaceae bacterium]|nr:hypothetical protein [Eubacteriaceae bacterium]